MPVSFLSSQQQENYGRYADIPTTDELTRYFHLDDADHALIRKKRGVHNRLGFAIQLGTVRYLGTFLENPVAVPFPVIQTLTTQLEIQDISGLKDYGSGEQRWDHAAEIRNHFGYVEITEPSVSFRLTRWLYALCWTGTDRPSILFERAVTWLVTHKVLLPGCSVLERYIARLRNRVEERFWDLLVRGLNREQKTRLYNLLASPVGSRKSNLENLRKGPTRVSSVSLVESLCRLQDVRNLGIKLPTVINLPAGRIAALARYANAAKVSALSRLPDSRKLATLVAFVYCLEATAQDEALEILEMLLDALFNNALKEDRKARLRSLKDLDKATAILANACQYLLDENMPDAGLRAKLFKTIPREKLLQALDDVNSLIRPADDVYYQTLEDKYRSVRRFLPSLINYIHFEANAVGMPAVEAFDWLRLNLTKKRPDNEPPSEILDKSWQHHVYPDDGQINIHAYAFCALKKLQRALKKRDVFVAPSWRYADPRANLLSGEDWESSRPIICRTLGLPATVAPCLEAIAGELDFTYHSVESRLSENASVNFDSDNGKYTLIISPLDKITETDSLAHLRETVIGMLPQVELPELILEIAARTSFTDAFTHISERSARAADLTTSICAVLMAEACNTGLEPLVRTDVPALKRDRLSWVDQNYNRIETQIAANAVMVEAQSKITLAHYWGGGEVASADGMRFVVSVRTVHAGYNPKYFGYSKGLTWYNLMSDQFSGLNAIPVAGTLRDSLVLLAVVLEQQTHLQPSKIITDTGAYSDVVFGLFRLLGFRFSPRLADMGGTRFWRIDPNADYGLLDRIATNQINLNKIIPHWDDMLRLVGSLKLGKVPAAGIMRTLQVGDHPTPLAKAIAEFGRIEKTLHTLNYIDDETKRRDTLTQLNRTESRHSVARAVFHGKRGELRQHYREGQEDQLGALGLVLNMIVLWNTIYMDAALNQLRSEGYPVKNEDVARLSPLLHEHINMLGRYSFAVPESVAKGELRPFRDPKSNG